jgi:hypothetical protein
MAEDPLHCFMEDLIPAHLKFKIVQDNARVAAAQRPPPSRIVSQNRKLSRWASDSASSLTGDSDSSMGSPLARRRKTQDLSNSPSSSHNFQWTLQRPAPPSSSSDDEQMDQYHSQPQEVLIDRHRYNAPKQPRRNEPSPKEISRPTILASNISLGLKNDQQRDKLSIKMLQLLSYRQAAVPNQNDSPQTGIAKKQNTTAPKAA